jgi:hypothetical protein
MMPAAARVAAQNGGPRTAMAFTIKGIQLSALLGAADAARWPLGAARISGRLATRLPVGAGV